MPTHPDLLIVDPAYTLGHAQTILEIPVDYLYGERDSRLNTTNLINELDHARKAYSIPFKASHHTPLQL